MVPGRMVPGWTGSADALTMTMNWLLFAVMTLVTLFGVSKFLLFRGEAKFARSEVAAADALYGLGIGRRCVLLDVLARAGWADQDCRVLLGETGGDKVVAEDVLAGITRALCLDHIFGRQRLDSEGMTRWVRVAMTFRDDGITGSALTSAVSDAITGFDVSLPLRYTAWAYAAGMGREEASARWRTARVNMDEVHQMARANGMDLSAPHALAAAAN